MAKRKTKKKSFAEAWEQACKEGKAPIPRWDGEGGNGIHKYEYKLMTGDVPHRNDGDFREQAQNYRAASEHMRFIRMRVQFILQGHGVRVINFVTYYNFAARVDSLARRFGGATLRQWVRVTVQDWLARGCDPDVLKHILSEVFCMGEGEGKE